MKQSTGLIIAAGVTALVMACAGTAAFGFAAVRAVDRASSGRTQQEQQTQQAQPAQPAGPSVQMDQGPAQPAQTQQTQQTQQAQPNVRLSTDQAVSIAMRMARGATLLETPQVVSLRGGVQAYEVKLDVGTLYIDANTGRLLGATRPQNPPSQNNHGGQREQENRAAIFENNEQEHEEND